MNDKHRTKQVYIKALELVLKAKENVRSLDYRKHPSNGEEYLVLTATTGEVFMFDITKYPEAKILDCMAMAIAEGLNACDNLIIDRDKRLELGKLFN